MNYTFYDFAPSRRVHRLRGERRRKEGVPMEGTKPRTASSLGMFDLLKGVGMLLIVFAHTSELYPLGDASAITPATFFLFAYREALMAAFYIASGYGFRKRSIGKCVNQQFKTLFKPYVYTGLATTVLHLFVHYKTFGNWNNAVYETFKVFGGFLLGLPHTATYFGQTFFSCGPMWYLLALMIGWILLDVILNVFPEQYINWAVLGTMLLGWGISLVWEAPFCIAQGMVVVPYLYVGFLAKKNRLFDKRLRPLAVIVLLVAILGVAAGVLLTGTTDCVSLGEWTMGPLSIVLDTIVGFGFIVLFLRVQRVLDNPVTHLIEAVGRRSLYIFCIHTVELTVVPWYLLAQNYADDPMKGLWLQFGISLASIFVLCELLVRRRDMMLKFFPNRRKRFAAHPRYATKR